MRQDLVSFIQKLRRAGVRISVAETLDALAAVEIVGVERTLLRESLSATLVKEESDRGRFDALFDLWFPLLPGESGEAGKRRVKAARSIAGEAGSGGRAAKSEGTGTGESKEGSQRPNERPRDGDRDRPLDRPSPSRDHAGDRTEPGSSVTPLRSPTPRSSTPRSLTRRPFELLDPDQIDAAKDVARELGRRFRARLARRERRMRRGRIDIRRTIRGSIARGGALIDLRHRGRRPGKPHLVVLCDVSGSVALASDLLLSLLAPLESAFASVRRYVFVDRPALVAYEGGHIAPEEPFDPHAYSDLGATFLELERREAGLLDRRSVLLVLGDARNNRYPARPDALRRLASQVRAVIFLVPEPRARWNTGDSALASYAPHVDLLLEATHVLDLLKGVRRAATAARGRRMC